MINYVSPSFMGKIRSIVSAETMGITMLRPWDILLYDCISLQPETKDEALEMIKQDIYHMLRRTDANVNGLIMEFNDGNVDGLEYETCPLGIIAKDKGVRWEKLSPNEWCMAEQWFMTIYASDTPKNNEQVALTVEWLQNFEG